MAADPVVGIFTMFMLKKKTLYKLPFNFASLRAIDFHGVVQWFSNGLDIEHDSITGTRYGSIK